MNKPQPISPRRRLQALLAIPERDRTDEEWDEMNELEIMLAPGNRGANQVENGQRNEQRNEQPLVPYSSQPGGGVHGKRSAKQFHRRKRKNKVP